jgi:hypothetical protein
MCKCKICNKEFSKIRHLSSHLSKYHNIKLLDYYIEYEKFKIPKCIICDKDAKIYSGIIYSNTCGDKECIRNQSKLRIHSTETKILQSEKRKNFLKLNPDKHSWKKKNKQLSVPCELFKTKLNNSNINYVEEYSPVEDRFFSIDIAFPDKKIGIEINGNQHYDNNGKLKKYYQERKDIIEKSGWKLYDIYYTKVYDVYFCDSFINEFKNNNLETVDYSVYLYKKEINTCVDCGCEIYKYSKRCVMCNGKNRIKKDMPNYEILKEQILKFGYCGTGRIYGVSDNTIRKWLKRMTL